MSRPVLLLVVAALLGAAPAEVPAFTEKEVKAYVAGLQRDSRDRSTQVRVTAASDLELFPCVPAAEVAHRLLADPEAPVRFAAINSLSHWNDPEALAWLCTKGLKKGSTECRARVIRALGFGEDSEQVRAALVGQLDSKKPVIKAAAIVAVANLRHRPAMERIRLDAADSEMRVREAVAIAIGLIGSSACMDEMRSLIADESWEVRAAMIQAAARLEIKPVVSLLVSRLPVEDEPRLRRNLRDSLGALTGEDFGYDAELWISWWNANKDEYGVTEKIEIVVKEEDYAKVPEYHGIRIESSKVLFLIDVSDSMHKGGREVRTGELDKEGKPVFELAENNMEVAKAELIRVVRGLDARTRFNVMTYSTETDRWKAAPLEASAANKKAAVKWIKSLNVKRMTSTDTYGALMEALGARGKSIAAAARAPQRIDSIYFLADGEPTTGITTDPEQIRRDVQLANPDARIEIHTILIGDGGGLEFMKNLAADNAGKFVHAR